MFDQLFFTVGSWICQIAAYIGANRYVAGSCGDPASVAHHWLAVLGILTIFEEIFRRTNKSDDSSKSPEDKEE